jgi:SMODS-associating 4TM effector domain
MNNIPDNENRLLNLQHFAASRRWYARGKTIAETQAWIGIGFPLLAAVIVAWSSSAETKAWITFSGISATIVEAVLFDPMQRSRRTKGAVEQEMFDCAVLELTWPAGLAGAKPGPEATADVARKFLTHDPTLSMFKEWYPADVAQLPIHLGRLVCQRGNAWWDSQERSQYARLLRCLSVAVVVTVVVIGLTSRIQLWDLVSTVYAPLSPLVVWGFKERQRHAASSELSTRLQSEAERAWNEALPGVIDENEATRRSRDIQNGIFYKRSTAPFLPNWLKRRQQEKYQGLMAEGVKHLLEQARRPGVI